MLVPQNFQFTSGKNGKLFECDLHAEVAASHHDSVGGLEDFVEIVDALLVFDLRDEALMSPGLFNDATYFEYVLRASHEGQRDEVEVLLESKPDVLAVLLRDGRKVHPNARKVHVLARAQRPAVEDPTLEPMLGHFEDLEIDEAVVDRNAFSDAEIVDEVHVVHVDAPLFGIVGEHAEVKNIASVEIETLRQLAGPNFRPLKVHQNRDGVRELLVETLEVSDDLQV